MFKYRKLLTFFLFASLFCLSFYILFTHLGKADLENWDEAWYGEMTKQMLKTGDFVTLHWNGQVLLDKPPMLIWLNAVVVSLMGLSEFSLRLTPAVSGFLVIILATLYAYRNWGVIPSLVTFSAISLNHLFIWRSRSGNIDSLVSLLIFLIFLVAVGKHKYRYYLLGILFAAVYLTKASLVAFPLFVFLGYELLYRRKDLFKDKRNFLGLWVLFMGLTGLWLFLGYLKAGPDFVNYYLFKSDQGVAHLDPTKFKLDYFWHAYYALQRRLFPLFILGLLFLVKDIKKGVNFLLLIFSLFLLITLSFTKRDNNWYLLPSMPFWALTIGYGVYSFIGLLGKWRIVNMGVSFFLLTSVFYLSYKTFTVNIQSIINAPVAHSQAEGAAFVKKLSQPEDVVVRLDHLYPATVYYSDRKVLSYPYGQPTSGGIFLSTEGVVEAIKNKQVLWLVGGNADVESLIGSHPDLNLTKIKANNEEMVLRVN